MSIPKIVATTAIVVVLGAQSAIASPPLLARYGWNWPFLPYPMYAAAHARTDTLVVSELRVASCDGASPTTLMSPEMLGTPLYQLPNLLSTIARAPESADARNAKAKISRAIEAEFPARYCSASAWVRTVLVADAASYALDRPMRPAAVWPIGGARSE